MNFYHKKTLQLLLYSAILAMPAPLLAAVAPLDPQGISTLSQETKGKSQVKLNNSHGAARFVNIVPSQRGSLTAFKGATPKATLDDFLTKHGKLFGVNSVTNDLKLLKSKQDNLGFTQIRYQQVYKGIPVYGSDIVGNVNKAGELRSVNGRFIPNLNVGTTPLLTVDKAKDIAVKELKAELMGDDSPRLGEMTVKDISLVVFNPSISADKPGASHLAYQIKVTTGMMAQLVFVDAQNGFVLGKRDLNRQALQRRVYDAEQFDINLVFSTDTFPKNYPNQPFWVEGNAFPTTSQPFPLPNPAWKSTNDALAATKTIYDLYKNTFNIDAPDGLGTKMDTVLNFTTGNAFAYIGNYPALRTGFGLDLVTDDIVGHEWQHWYTSFMGTDLDYFAQPGALNEAYSDIFGEVVDEMNIGMPFGGSDSPNTLRTDGTCALFSAGAPEARTVKLTIHSPPSIAEVRTDVGLARFGALVPTAGLNGDLVHVDDGSTALVIPGQEPFVSIHDACQVPFVNDVSGKIALIKRGNCNFIVKVANAESEGATGVIVYNREEALTNMGGSPPPNVTIPSIFIVKSLGESLAATLVTDTVNVTMQAEQEPRYTDNTLRWVSGEDAGVPLGSNAVVGLRDLWDPTCLGLPGKVSDSQYTCASSDNRGVHTNSSVPNHGFALIVDGGNYNLQNISGLGFTKATHLYHRAQLAYQTSNMSFTDHADALEQACADLTGQDLKALGSTTISGDEITVADCVNVAKAMDAVEMRLDPACPVLAGFASIAPIEMLEGNSGTTDMVFQVQLSAIMAVPAIIDYEAGALEKFNPASDAQNGVDYLPTKGTLVIPAGSQSGVIVVKIKGDKTPEGDEFFALRVSSGNVNITTAPFGRILNDD